MSRRVSREQVVIKRQGRGERPRELGADFTLLELPRIPGLKVVEPLF